MVAAVRPARAASSSARWLRRRDVNLLPGRIHRHAIFPVCLWEQDLQTPGEILPVPDSAAPIERPFPRRSLEDTLVFGSLPAAFIEGDAYGATLESYAESYIEEEVLRESAACQSCGLCGG